MKLSTKSIVALAALVISLAAAAWYLLPQYLAKRELATLGISYSDHAFVESACGNNKRATLLFIKAGMSVNAKNDENVTALHCAAQTGNTDLIHRLIEKKADVNAGDLLFTRPLHAAVQAGKIQSVKMLLDAGANINAMTGDGSPLFLAAAAGDENISLLLLERGADIRLTDKWGGTALNAAMESGRSEAVIRLLIDKGANPNSKSRMFTALFAAARSPDLTRLLLSKGANPNLKNDDGSTPLHAAAHNKNNEVGVLLLNAGADIGAVAKGYGTPLHVAAGSGNVIMAEFLLSKGADVNSLNCCGNNSTPLHEAVAKTNPNDFAMIELLLERGANVNAMSFVERTPLMEARSSSLPVVQLLVDKGANVNSRGPNGGPSVLSWFKNRKSEATNYLISKGARD